MILAWASPFNHTDYFIYQFLEHMYLFCVF